MDAYTEHTSRIDTRLGALHARIVGTGRTTVLWSSMFVDGHTWDRILPLLIDGSAEPRRFVLLDPPGLGLSDPLTERTTIAAAADAARDAIAALDPDGPVDWAGNAFGGHVGLDLATAPTPLRSLVAISSPTQPIPRGMRVQIAMLRPLLRLLGPVTPIQDAVLDAMLTEESATTPVIREVVLRSLVRPTKGSMNLAIRSFIVDRTDVTDRLADIVVPSLFVASDDRGDWSPADAERAASLAPGARVVTIARARTLIPLERPEALAAEILEFWRALPV